MYDIVSIGDCTIDAFLEVQEAKVRFDENHENPELCFPFGDKIPYQSLTLLSAGNANNVAVGMSRLGFKAAYYGSVGHDHNSHVILNKLREEKVHLDFMSIQKGHSTNFHVVLWHGGERTILIRHEDFAYKLPKGIEKTKWIYLTSVGKKGLALHTQITQLLNKHQDIKMSFNPGTFQLRLGLKKLMPLLKRTEILNVNKEEAELLVGKHEEVQKLAHSLSKVGPKTIVITDGLSGSYCLDKGAFYQMGIYPHKPIESTGCGDAYATAFTAARMYNLSVPESMRWAARNGAACATAIGPQAGLVNKKQMLSDLNKHKEVKAKIISN